MESSNQPQMEQYAFDHDNRLDLTFDEPDVIKPVEQNEKFEPEIRKYSQKDIVEAISVCLKGVSPMIQPRNTLTNMVYFILKSWFMDGKRFVVAECPTGSGKTIIGFMVYFCTQYLEMKANGAIPAARPKMDFDSQRLAYYITSNKVLQEQIDNDIRRFEFQDYMYLLKGTDNYECFPATARFKKELNFRQRVLDSNPKATFASYNFRPCSNCSGERLKKKFPNCYDKCPYKSARAIAASKACSIFNYAYFLNVMRNIDDGNPNKYFARRLITICDEAHLLPDIVCNFFNIELNQALCTSIRRTFEEIIQSFGEKQSMSGWKGEVGKALHFFYNPVNRLSEILDYLRNLEVLYKMLKAVHSEYTSESFNMMFGDKLDSLKSRCEEYVGRIGDFDKLFTERPGDVYFESEEAVVNTQLNVHVYKHIVKDLKEAELVRTHFLNKINYGLFMSATLGNKDDYATLMGMKSDEYAQLFLPSTFDFSKSPIYICNSAWLNYANFDRNIDKVLMDTIKICQQHPNEKGVIHTATFKITQLLKERIQQTSYPDLINRFIFYSNAKEKEEMIELFRSSLNIPYIFVGPSLYEGIDLPDDKCRFQILVKVPYAQMTGYIKKKSERYPFWYKRNCIEKIIQAIGRSNRHVNDWSKVYLLDSCFDKIIYDCGDTIVERLEYNRI